MYIGAEVYTKVSVGILARYVYSELDGKQMFDFGHQMDRAFGQHVKSDQREQDGSSSICFSRKNGLIISID